MAVREIKFRAWDGTLMHSVADLEWRIKGITFYGPGVGTELVDGERVHLMQYTGLKDKNGVEIYEGDILDYRKDTNRVLMFEVVFDHASFCRRWISKDTAKIRGLEIETLAYNTSTIFEVIGNIYENPELLEVNK